MRRRPRRSGHPPRPGPAPTPIGPFRTWRAFSSNISSTIRPAACWTADGTAVFVDISGFTKLSERLARKGREGAEQITEAIGEQFRGDPAVAYENGGSLLKFGGDALLLWFEGEGHAARACRAAVLMRRVLRSSRPDRGSRRQGHAADDAGRAFGQLPFLRGGHVPFRVAPRRPRVEPPRRVGALGRRRRDHGEPGDGGVLAELVRGRARGAGMLLRREPPGHTEKLPLVPRPKMPAETARALPVRRRARARPGRRRDLRAPSRHDRIRPFRGDGCDDRTQRAARRRPRRSIGW